MARLPRPRPAGSGGVAALGGSAALRLAGIALFALVAPAPAAAGNQQPPGVALARCVVAKDTTASRALVLSAPGSADEPAALARLGPVIASCAHTGTPTATPVFRGDLAEVLWARGPGGFKAIARDLDLANQLDFDAGFEASGALRPRYGFAACVAYLRPQAVDTLLKTPRGSKAETTAFAPLAEVFPTCLLKDATMRLGRPTARLLFAEQLYRYFQTGDPSVPPSLGAGVSKDAGPPPSLDRLHELGERAVAKTFEDQGGAKISWDTGMVGGYVKGFSAQRYAGWWSCGFATVKPRNDFKTVRRFIVVVAGDRVSYSAIGNGQPQADFVSLLCDGAARRQWLQPGNPP